MILCFDKNPAKTFEHTKKKELTNVLTCLWFKLIQNNLFGSHKSFEIKWQNSAIYSEKQSYKKV